MNEVDIIHMAYKACVLPSIDVFSEDIVEFARLIAEDCAKRCEAESDAFREGGWNAPAAGAGTCATAIREAYRA